MSGMWSLAPLSIVLGAVLLWAFGRVSNQEAIRRARRRLQACLYELRLFTDEPALIWRAQATLLWVNLRYLSLMLYPMLILTIPMVLLFALLEPFYGKAPLAPGEPAIVTVKMAYAIDPSLPPPLLQAPEGVVVETPPVRVLAEREVSWRIRALRPASGHLRVVLPTEILTKSVVSGEEPRFLSGKRVRSLWSLLLHPTEGRLPEGAVDWIAVQYPSRTIVWLGFRLHWLVWLVLISMATALLLKRRLGVAF
jgi:uncharacterized membrane protein (DUF106 family)